MINRSEIIFDLVEGRFMPALLNRFLRRELPAADDSGARLELPREIEGSHDHADESARSAAYPFLEHVGIKRSRQHERPRGMGAD